MREILCWRVQENEDARWKRQQHWKKTAECLTLLKHGSTMYWEKKHPNKINQRGCYYSYFRPVIPQLTVTYFGWFGSWSTKEEQDLLEILDLELLRVTKSRLDLDWATFVPIIYNLLDNNSILKSWSILAWKLIGSCLIYNTIWMNKMLLKSLHLIHLRILCIIWVNEKFLRTKYT